jgi:hypothetical protein
MNRKEFFGGQVLCSELQTRLLELWHTPLHPRFGTRGESTENFKPAGPADSSAGGRFRLEVSICRIRTQFQTGDFTGYNARNGSIQAAVNDQTLRLHKEAVSRVTRRTW